MKKVKVKQKNNKTPFNIETDTAIMEYLDILKSEYAFEREKKQSFENRVGIILAVIGAICIFLLEHVQIKDIINLMSLQITFLVWAKIISGIIVYIAFIFTLLELIMTIKIRPHENFAVEKFDNIALGKARDLALIDIIENQKNIILQHQELNQKRAKTFRRSLFGMFTIVISTIIYISL